MTARDQLLIDLINRVEMAQTTLPITVVAQGSVITGHLVAHRTWARAVARRLSDSDLAAHVFAEDFEQEGEAPQEYPPAFLHVQGCQVVVGDNRWGAPVFGEYFRVPLSAVSAWSVT